MMTNTMTVDTMKVEETTRFVDALMAYPRDIISRTEIGEIVAKINLPFPHWFVNCDAFKVGYNQFRKTTFAECRNLRVGYYPRGRRVAGNERVSATQQDQPNVAPVMTDTEKEQDTMETIDVQEPKKFDMLVQTHADVDISREISRELGVDVLVEEDEATPYIPSIDPLYVKWGWYSRVETIINSRMFLPLIVTGPSGNGKTQMIEQVCANLGREYVRLNITAQTDEDDMIGGFRLINGETKFALGPIPVAALRGAVCLLDEFDLGGADMMCLQPVLEGKPFFIKKINKWITPKPGFTVLATSNTKGRGDDGRYAHTQIQNDAMLERFTGMFVQAWPDAITERKIVSNVMKSLNIYSNRGAQIAKHLVDWATVTRENYGKICFDQIATRRLIHVVRNFAAVGDLSVAVEMAMSRFDEDTQTAFRNLWVAIHGDGSAHESPSGTAMPEPVEQESPF